MNLDLIKRRIGELATQVMHEDDAEKLLQLMLELDQLIDIYLTHAGYENPPPC